MWHNLVPKDPEKNVRFRLDILKRAEGDRLFQRGIWEICRQDIYFYIDTFVNQYNPMKGEGAGPFILWDFQESAVKRILESIECHCNEATRVHGHDLLIEKSREMGASWLCLIVMEWLWHFRPWKKFLCISRSEEAVEADDPDCLFWKIDFIHRYLPDWLKPRMRRRKLFFGNEDNHSTITGQASTGRAGVGGRATAMFIDEFSQIKEDVEVSARTSDTTNCRIFNSTHKGTNTEFARMASRSDMRKLVMHWSQHPEKKKGSYRYDAVKGKVDVIDKAYTFPQEFKYVMSAAPSGGPHPGLRSPWYDLQCSRKPSARAVAEDLDIDPGGSASQFFNPLTIRSLRTDYAREPDWQGDVAYDRDTGQPSGLVESPGGPLVLWIHPDMDSRIPAGKYSAGADVSTGAGATNSVISIVNARTGMKTAEYATAHILPEHFAVICVALCRLFKDEDGFPCLFGWECAGPGSVLTKRVPELGYPHMYYRTGMINDKMGPRAKEPGWHPSPLQKRILLEEYRTALENREYINLSDIALKECEPYHYNGQGGVEHPHETMASDPTGARVNHGDRVIADALSWKLARSLNVYQGRNTKEKQEEQVGTYAWRRKLAEEKQYNYWDAWRSEALAGWGARSW